MYVLPQLIIITKKTTAKTFGFKRNDSFNKYLLSISVCETWCRALETFRASHFFLLGANG